MKKSSIIIVLNILVYSTSFSLNLTWTGASNHNWNDSTNFSPMIIPTMYDTVTIDTTAHYPILVSNVRIHKLMMMGDTLDLNGYQLEISDAGIFSRGVITGGLLKCRGTVAEFSGTVIDAAVDALCSGIRLSGSTFHQTCYFETNGSESSTGTGGNEFWLPVTIKHGGTGTDFRMATVAGDIFHDSLTVINTGAKEIQIAVADVSFFHQVISMENHGTGSLIFGRTGGVSKLLDDADLTVNSTGFSSGMLMLTNIIQENTIDIRIELAKVGLADQQAMLLLTDNRFSGNVDMTAPGLLLKGNRFEGSVILTKTGGNHDHSDGGNDFFGATTLMNSGTSGNMRLGNNSSDYFREDLTLISGTKHIFAGYKANAYLYENVKVDSATTVLVNALLCGTTDQILEGAAEHQYGSLTLDKPSGKAIAQTPLGILTKMNFRNGHLETDTTHLVTFVAGSEAIDASNASFVSGPVKKVGNTAFEFPVGKGGYYRPMGISAPGSVTDAFRAEYFDEEQAFGSTLDSALIQISECNYWTLNLLTGNSSVKYSLTWNQDFCWEFDTTYMNIASFESGQWNNLGHGSVDGNIFSGRITTSGFHQGDRILTLSMNSSFPIFFPDLGLAFGYGVLSYDSVMTNAFHIFGKAGANGMIDSILTATDSTNSNGVGSVPASIAALDSMINHLDTIVGTLLNNNLDDISLFQGLYEISGNAYLNDTLRLFGDSNSVFVFKITDSLIVEAESRLKLNGVHPKNVFWKADSGVYINTNDRFYGVIISGGASHIENNGGQIAVLSKGAVQIVNNEPYNYTNHIRAAELMYMPFEFLFASPCTGPEFDCNLIINPGFESGSVPNAQDGFEWGWVDCWTNQVCQHMAGCNNPISMGGNNTPDIMDENAPVGNGFRPCDNSNPPFMYDSFSIPENTMAANTPSLTPSFYGIQSNQNDRYATMFTGETIGAELKEPISPGFYIVGFWARATDCFCPGQLASVCLTLYDDNTSCSQLRNLGDINLLGVDNTQWTFYAECIDLTTGNVGQFNHLGFKMTFDNRFIQCPAGQALSNGRIFVDDFVFFKVADAGPDLYTCGNPIQLEPPCENPYFTYSYDWQVISGSGATPDPVMNPWVNPSGTTTYEVTVTIAGPNNLTCIDVDQVTVNTVSNLSVGLTTTGSCNGSGGTISASVAGGTSPYQYLWSTGSTAASLNNLPSGTYTVTVSDANGCTETQNGIVTNVDNSFVLTGDFLNCQFSGDLCFQITPYNASNWNNYQWSVGVSAGPPPTLNVNTVTGEACADFDPGVGGLITVTYIMSGCTTNYALPIVECCELPGSGEEIRDDINSSDLLTINSPYINNVGGVPHIDAGSSNFIIQKTITLDTDLVIENSPNVYFGPGGGIIVPNGFTLSVFNSTLQGCDFMWRGVRIQNGGMILTFSPTFKDAHFAVDAENGGNYIIRNGTFTDNHIGLRASGSNYVIRMLQSALFEGSGPLLPDFPSQTPATCNIGYAGIQATDVASVLNIGVNPSTNDIEFNDLVYGIISENSNINVVGCTFDNIQTNSTFNTCYGNPENVNGSGIYSVNRRRGPRTLYQRGFGMSGTISFNDSRFGILTRRTISNVQLNNMTNNEFGIRTFANYMGRNTILNQNSINSYSRGIEVIDAQVLSTTNVFYNNVSLNGSIIPGGVLMGISMTNQFGGLGITEVIENEVTIESIHHRGISNSFTLMRNGILQNDVFFNGTGNVNRGIWAESSPDIEIKCNTITGNSTTQGTGINVSLSPNGRVECNSTTDTKHGIRFEGNNATVDFRTNTMNDHGIGFVLSNGSIIGDQYDQGNIWTSTTYSPFGAWSTANSDATLSKFYVENPTSGQFQTTRSNDPLFTVDFFPGCNNNCWPVCSTNVDCSIRPIMEETFYLNRLDSLVAQDSVEFVQFHDYTVWSLKRNLYRKLLRDTSLAIGNQLFEDFFENAEGTSYAKSAQIIQGLLSLTEAGGDEMEIIVTHLNTTDSLKQLVLLNDSIIMNPPSSQDSLDLIDDNIIYRAIIDSLTLTTDTMILNIDERIKTEVQELITLNASMSVSTQFEEILRTMNAISFRLLLDDPTDRDLSQSEKDWVRSVASLCPFEYGESVYQARNIANIMLGDTLSYDDDSLCVMVESRISHEDPTPLSITDHRTTPIVKVYPNPFTSDLTVECTNCTIEPLMFEIYNTMGVMSQKGKVIKNQVKGNKLAPGLYFIKVFDNNQLLHSAKIVKQ